MLFPPVRRAPSAARSRAWPASLAVALCLGAPQAWPADALTLDGALRLAQDRSRQLSAQQSAADAAREMAAAARERPDPTLRIGVNNLPVDGPDRFSLTRDFMTMRSVGVAQELTRGSKLQARSARFEREAEVAEAMRQLALANLQRDTAAAWLDRHYRERMRDVLASQRDEARLQVEAADAAYRSGRAPQADVFAARSGVALIDDRIAEAERQIATATTQLARWVGAAAAGPVAATLPPLDAVRFRPEDTEAGLAHHAGIAVLRGREAAAQADVDTARADAHADPSVELMYGRRGPAYSNMVSLNLALPLQWNRANRQDREIAARLAALEQARAEREDATGMHAAEALALWQEWRSGRERLVRHDAALIPLAAERTRAALAAYRGASGPLGAVLEARRGEIDARLARLRLEMETARAWAQLNYLAPAGHPMPAAAPRAGDDRTSP